MHGILYVCAVLGGGMQSSVMRANHLYATFSSSSRLSEDYLKKPPKNNNEEQESLEKDFTAYEQKDYYSLRKHVKPLHYSVSKSRNINRFPTLTEEESARKHSENISTLYDLGHGDRFFVNFG